jgi:hypothetical protein
VLDLRLHLFDPSKTGIVAEIGAVLEIRRLALGAGNSLMLSYYEYGSAIESVNEYANNSPLLFLRPS